MMWLKLAPWGLALIGAAAAGFLFWQLGKANERIGGLEAANKAFAKALSDKADANRSRAVTQKAVRSMAPAEKLERLK